METAIIKKNTTPEKKLTVASRKNRTDFLPKRTAGISDKEWIVILENKIIKIVQLQEEEKQRDKEFLSKISNAIGQLGDSLDKL